MKPVAIAFACFLLTSCSGGLVRVSGAIVEEGKALEPKDDEEITLSFVATNPEAEVALASADFDPATSTFKVHGPAGDRIPPGTYKIAIHWTINRNDAKGGAEQDRFRGAFSEAKTPLQYTVTGQAVQELVVDVKARTVQPK